MRTVASWRRSGTPALDGVADLQDKKVALTFDNMPVEGMLHVSVRGPAKEITEVNKVMRIAGRAANIGHPNVR